VERIIHATYVDGVFKPTEPVDVPIGTKATVVIKEPGQPGLADREWDEFEAYCEANARNGLKRLTREQLHDRRL
jgi:predicted DNA-binding antitoxin AbrB/MazE fold protein